jgi:hypothetical protein
MLPSFVPRQSANQVWILWLQVLQLRESTIVLEAHNASLQADLTSAQASAGDAATAAAAVGDLRRQLEERGREVSDLASVSLKARCGNASSGYL